MNRLYSVVVPIYNNADSLPELIENLNWIAEKLEKPLEVIFVIDGSPDNSYVVLCDLIGRCKFSSKLCVHSRNFGHLAAIRTGLSEGSGDCFVLIAADLQEPPSLVLDFFKALSSSEVDVVIGTRIERDDPFFTKLCSNLFWYLYRKFVFPEIPVGGFDVFGCTSQVKNKLLELQELNSSLSSLLFWVGFKRVFVPYKRLQRKHGKSAGRFSRKLNLMLDNIYSFTNFPVRLLTWIGGVSFVSAFIFATIVLIFRTTGYLVWPGYASTILMVMFFGGLNSLGLGIVGEYAWRAFENTKKRPMAIVKSTQNYVAQ